MQRNRKTLCLVLVFLITLTYQAYSDSDGFFPTRPVKPADPTEKWNKHEEFSRLPRERKHWEVRELVKHFEKHFVYMDEEFEYWKTPWQTLWDGGGDCEDLAIFTAVFLRVAFGIEPFLVLVEDVETGERHMQLWWDGESFLVASKVFEVKAILPVEKALMISIANAFSGSFSHRWYEEILRNSAKLK